jgi:hypothetical protein
VSRLAGSAKLLRAMNSSAALAHLLQAGQLTRAELRELTGLSKPTTSEMLRVLTDAGLAVVTGRTAGGVGPTAEIYAPNGDAAYAVAISVRDTLGADQPDLALAMCDLGGTMRDRVETRVDFAATTPADAITAAVTAACRRAGIDRGPGAPRPGRRGGLLRRAGGPPPPRRRTRLGPPRHRRPPAGPSPDRSGDDAGHRERREAGRDRGASPGRRRRRGQLLPAVARHRRRPRHRPRRQACCAGRAGRR